MKPAAKKAAVAAAFVALAGTGIGIGAVMNTTSPPAKTSPGTVSVLTGKPGTAGRVLAVKIDNVGAARPATGLNGADIVYAIRVEGGLSRLMAIFDTHNGIPSVVGPMRSARETDLRLLAEYNNPGLSFSGAQSRLLPVLRSSPEIQANGSRGAFRSSARFAPHNEYLRTKGLAGGKARDIGLRFGAAPAGGTNRTTVVTSMPAARFGFVWHGGVYQVYMDRARSPWTTSNVIIQHVKIRSSRFLSRTGFVPFTETVGSGTGVVLRNGKSYNVTWHRPSRGAGTTYTFHGKTMRLHPGRTWVVLN